MLYFLAGIFKGENGIKLIKLAFRFNTSSSGFSPSKFLSMCENFHNDKV